LDLFLERELPRYFLENAGADHEGECQGQDHRPGIECQLETVAIPRDFACHVSS
jgi:hypothetical protein